MKVGDYVKSTDPFDNLLVFEIISISDIGVVECKVVGTKEIVWRHATRLYLANKKGVKK